MIYNDEDDILQFERYGRAAPDEEATQANAPTGALSPVADPAESAQLTQPVQALSDKTTRRVELSQQTVPTAVGTKGKSEKRKTPQSTFTPPPAPPSTQVREDAERYRAPHRRDGLGWVFVTILSVGLVIMLGIGLFMGARVINSGDPARVAAAQTPTLIIPTYDATAAAAFAFNVPTSSSALTPTAVTQTQPQIGLDIRAWNGTERFTVLMLGLDKRPNQQGTAFRTDSMMLISLDPTTGSIGILSIPRDLYVEIPPDTVVGSGYGLQRVNTAYYLGELARPGYGAALAMQTVQYNLGIRVHDYVVYDFEAIIRLIDAVGGVQINVLTPISDPLYPDMYGGYEPLYIRAGMQQMDGALALKYARTRHSSSDIHRAQRQQEVMMALRQKILSTDLVPSLLAQVPSLWAGLDRHISSGLSLEQLIQLLLYAKDIQTFRQGVIDYRYVTDVMWQGQAVLVPNRARIGGLLVEVFGAGYTQ